MYVCVGVCAFMHICMHICMRMRVCVYVCGCVCLGMLVILPSLASADISRIGGLFP